MQTDKITTQALTKPTELSIFRLLCGAFLTVGVMALPAMAQPHQSLQELAHAARDHLVNAGGRQLDDSMTVEIQAPDPRLRLQPCSQPLEAFLAPGARAFGNTSVGVRCAGQVPWTVYVRARVRVWQEVLVSRGALSRGDRLGPDDVMMQKMDVSQVTGRFLHQPAQAMDLQLSRSVAPGVILTRQMLREPQLIKRGERVTLIAQVGNLSVRVAGTALSAGAKGDQISVRNASSGRHVQGVIVASGTVRTDSGALAAHTPRLAGTPSVPYKDRAKDFLTAADQ